MQSVSIHTEKQAYATNTDITFRAQTEEPDPVEFLWHFGDSRPLRTTSRSFKKTYHTPDRYSVVVVASNGLSSFTSEVHPVLVQIAVRPNRLLFQPSVVLKHTASFTCRVNSGTNLSYTWSFGDGTSRTGGNTEQHVFHRTGEFTVEVTVSNLVSSASLTAQMFVVDRPCKPPAVKNMGPLKIQVRRYEPVGLGVTYEAEVQCDVFQGLEYNWSLYTSTGLPVPLPPVDTDRQSITLPSHFLHYGIYTAIARVQIVGSVVYSNYSVCVEVVPSPLVSFIHGGTNVFLSSRNSSVISLNGQPSYDPDYPMNQLRYYSWTCKPVSAIDSSCFDQYVPASFSVIVFPVGFLKRDFDQFRFTLTVQSGERSSTADTFITVTPSLLRVSVYCYQCQGDAVNWDQSFSVRAVCDSCGPSPRTISYTWTLYLVDSSSKVDTDGLRVTQLNILSSADCFSLIGFVALKYVGIYFKVYFISDLGGFDPGGPPYPISEYPVVTFDDGSILYSAPLGQSDIIEVFPIDPDFPTDYDFPFPVLESGDVSGRPGVGGGSSESSEGDSAPVPGSSEDEGSNLMDSSPSLVVLDPTLLDLPRELLEQELFESYTYTGISSALITFRPFTLRAGSRYMLEVTANSHDAVLGRTQLFLSTSPSPRGITCQVQPSSGFEIHTHFSIFCTSGKEDLLYEYSFSTGNSPPKILYQGRDFQYYFHLPSGDPQDDYKVTIYTEVRNRFGAATAPCPVTVAVHPSFIRDTSSNSNSDMELFESGLRNLSGLVQLGNSVEIRNYIILLSSVLNRLSQDPTANTHTQTHTRTALINAVCQLDINDQVHTLARTHAHTDMYIICINSVLLPQVSLASASVVVGHVQSISDLFHEPSVPVPYLLDSWTLNTLVTLLSYSLQATPTTNDVRQDQATADDVIQATPTLKEQAIQLTTDSLQTTDRLLLKYILFNKVEQHNVTTSVMDLQTTHHDRGLTTVISSGSATFYLPDSLDLVLYGRRRRETTDGPQSLCVLSQLITFTHNLYFWTKTPVLLSGPVIDLTLYNCSTRREIPVHSLSQPINIEFPKTPRNVSSLSEFTLLRSQVNYHGFNITQQALQEAILVSVEFTRPPNKTFPIMLLFRMFERPTPSLYHIHSIYHWDRNTTYITLPPSYLTGYLPSDVTVVCVCVVCVCLYALGMVVCKRADLISERNQGVYYLSDNAPSDTHLYSVTIHTGLRSSPSMTAKVEYVHIVLYGEDGASQTRQLHDPEFPLFRRNSRNTFILSTVDSLGPLWGLHLWHDNTGPSPTWYLRQVEVCEVKGKGRSWLFLGQCWLAVDEGDGQVERRLRVCDQGPGFTKLLYLKLSEYLSDFHLWLSVYSGPSPSVFTHTQRYMCVNTLLISGLDDQVSQSIISHCALAVLPVATALSFLFRQREVRVKRSEVKQDMVRLPDIYSIEGRTHTHTHTYTHTHTRKHSLWPAMVLSCGWALLFLCACVCMRAYLCAYVRFSSSKTLLWIHSVFFSLLSCVFLIQPAMVNQTPTNKTQTQPSMNPNLTQTQPNTNIKLTFVLAARQRARYLRLVRPPTSGELRRTGGRKRRETLIRKTLRLCISMLFLLLCVTYGSSFRDQYHLNHAVRTQFTSPHNPFLSIQTHEEWWNWTLTSVLDGLDWDTWYNNISGSCILIGEPILSKIDVFNASQCQVNQGSEFVSRLESLRSAGWLDRRTVAMATQFTLYSPSTNLFISVNLMAERLPGGALHTSARVQSARVYHSPTVWDYFSMACQLLFLLVSLVQLVLQICSAGEKGQFALLSVSLQVSILLVTLVYYIYYIYQSILTLEVIDLLQRHDFRTHVDVSLLSTWEQHTRTLRGILLFLLVVRCMCLSGVNRTMAASVTLLRLAFSRLLWPMLSGVVLLVALSSVGNLLLLRRSWGFSSLPHSVFTLLSLSRGQLGSRAPSLPMASQPHQLHSPNRVNRLIYIFSPQSFYLEEFESLVDELQFRLNAFSNSLHHTLPPKDIFSPTQSPSSLASQVGTPGCLTHTTVVLENQISHWTAVGRSGKKNHRSPRNTQWATVEGPSSRYTTASGVVEGHGGPHRTVVEVMVHGSPETEPEEGILGTVRQCWG
uniref:Polycystin 1 like 1, transient receptor potential channel interacting n=1 Tax=Salmo trutta TaxID=8032 RepID=A0A674DR28_SALTR